MRKNAMSILRWTPGVVVGLVLFVPAVPGAPSPKGKKGDSVRSLIEQLGSPRYATRARATRLLDQLGQRALPTLQEVARAQDPEVGRRAEGLVKKITRRLEAAQVLAGRRVRLAYKN